MTAIADGRAARREEARRFVTFIVTGGMAAGVNIVSRWVFSHAMVYEAAVTLGYLCGMVVAYLLARRYVFAPSGRGAGRGWKAEFGRFATVNAGSFLVVLAVSVLLARWLLPAIGWRWHADDVAHVVGVGSPIALSYYAHKYFSFGAAR